MRKIREKYAQWKTPLLTFSVISVTLYEEFISQLSIPIGWKKPFLEKRGQRPHA